MVASLNSFYGSTSYGMLNSLQLGQIFVVSNMPYLAGKKACRKQNSNLN